MSAFSSPQAPNPAADPDYLPPPPINLDTPRIDPSIDLSGAAGSSGNGTALTHGDGTPAAPESNTPVIAPEIQKLNETFPGMDFSGYTTPTDAQYAARQFIEQIARLGVESDFSIDDAVPAAPAPAPVIPPAEEDELDLDELDPAVRKVVERIQADNRRVQEQLQRQRDQELASKRQLAEHQRNEISRRAHSAIDKLADPRFGAGGTSTFHQQIGRRQILATADMLISGLKKSGQPIPVIEKIIEQAVYYHNLHSPAPAHPAVPLAMGVPAAPVAPGAAPPAPVPAAGTPRPLNAAQRNAVRNGLQDPQSAYLADSEFMNGARAIIARPR